MKNIFNKKKLKASICLDRMNLEEEWEQFLKYFSFSIFFYIFYKKNIFIWKKLNVSIYLDRIFDSW